GLLRYGHGSQQFADFVRGNVANRDSYLREKERRAGKRTVQVHRCRRDVETARGSRLATHARGQNWGARGAKGLESSLRADRNWRWRADGRQAHAKRPIVALG